jgi:hypothetical protein
MTAEAAADAAARQLMLPGRCRLALLPPGDAAGTCCCCCCYLALLRGDWQPVCINHRRLHSTWWLFRTVAAGVADLHTRSGDREGGKHIFL